MTTPTLLARQGVASRHRERLADRTPANAPVATEHALSAGLLASLSELLRRLVAWPAERRRAVACHRLVTRLGQRLLHATDPDEVRKRAWEVLEELCQAIPGLRILKVSATAGGLRIDGACAALQPAPAALSDTVLMPAHFRAESLAEHGVANTEELDTAAGGARRWVAVSLPDGTPDSWIVLGAPRGISRPLVAAVRSTISQTTLALRHRSLERQLAHLGDSPSTAVGVSATTVDEARMPLHAGYIDGTAPLDAERLQMALRSAQEEVVGEIAQMLQTSALNQTGGSRASASPVPRPTPEMVEAISTNVAERVLATLQQAAPPVTSDVEAIGDRADLADHAAELAGAVARDEIVVHYQPIVSAVDERCTGVEALARWQHPDKGLVPPAAFLDAARQSGAIHEIGRHVLRRAVIEGARWREEFRGQSMPVHVDVSPQQLDDDSFVPTVRTSLDGASLPPSLLVLEIGDSPSKLSTAARAHIQTLAEDGVQFALDHLDIGTTSVAELQELPLSMVKINSQAATTAERAGRGETIIEMAKRLRLHTIIDRVEDPQQRVQLRHAGAESTQGFLHAHAVSAEEFQGWLLRHTPSGSAVPSGCKRASAARARRQERNGQTRRPSVETVNEMARRLAVEPRPSADEPQPAGSGMSAASRA